MPVSKTPLPLPDLRGQASVLDPWWKSAARAIGSLLGVDDPAGQAMGMAGPMTVVGKAAQAPAARVARAVERFFQPRLPFEQVAGRAPAATAAERAAEQGFTQDVYHGTKAKWSWMDDPELRRRYDQGEDITGPTSDAIKAFDLGQRQTGLKLMDGLGIHTGTPEAANQRLEQNLGKKFGTPKRPVAPGPLTGSYVLPLKGKAEKPFVKANGQPYSETELQAKLAAIARQLGHTETRRYRASSPWAGFERAQEAVKRHLQAQGYDSVPYINSHEGRGSISWIFFEPEQLRSRFAAFDAAKTHSRDLLASLLGPVGAGTLAASAASQAGQVGTPPPVRKDK